MDARILRYGRLHTRQERIPYAGGNPARSHWHLAQRRRVLPRQHNVKEDGHGYQRDS